MVPEGGFSGFGSPTSDFAEPFVFAMLFGPDVFADSLIFRGFLIFQIPLFCNAFCMVLDGGFCDFGAASWDFTKPFVL